MNTLERAFSRNRAEEMGPDLWGDFIVPPYFDRLQVMYVRKPYVIVGGRGCGKTTLLRYWSYHSQFSPKRKTLSDDVFDTIGLYIRTDIQFLSSFVGSSNSEPVWASAFEHALCLSVADELLGCLAQINCTSARTEQYGGHEKVDFSDLTAFDPRIPADYASLHKFITQSRFKLATWINNLDTDIPKPTFYPLRPFVGAMIAAMQALPYLKNTVFAVFVDEYESFLKYQQIFVNSLMKLSQPPLVFHVAMKRNGMPCRETNGPEMIQDKSDYRTIDIEKEQGNDFDTFAAELFFFRLMQQNVAAADNPVELDMLTDPARLAERRNNSAYRAKLMAAIERVLPAVSQRDVAIEALKESSLRDRLASTIKQGLIRRNPGKLTVEDFIDPDFPEASVVCAALLHQKKDPADIHAELTKLKSGEPSLFITSDWIHHFLFGSLLYLYAPLARSCALYSGFSTFIALSQGNARHFLELCHLAISHASRRIPNTKSQSQLTVNAKDQADAAKECSALFLEDVKGSGNYGKQLHLVATTLGQIFKLSQQRPSQSEPERNHFAVSSGELSDDAQVILSEAEKWGVLIGQEETKVKNSKYESREYRLNPIFAPSYGISFRRGRKLDLAGALTDRLLLATTAESTKIIREFTRSWQLDTGTQLSLIDSGEQS